MEKQCIELNISIYNNLAACLLQLSDSKAERIKEVTEVVIELDASNEKAWFRQGPLYYKGFIVTSFHGQTFPDMARLAFGWQTMTKPGKALER